MDSGKALLSFVDAVVRKPDTYTERRQKLVDEVGLAGLTEAAATIAAFSGLVRIADATGIALDDGTLEFSDEMRAKSGLNDFVGATNSDLDRAYESGGATEISVKGLFT